jgi:hypothetical protein
MSNDKVQSIMALVRVYGEACAIFPLGADSERAIDARSALESAIREAIAAPGVAQGWVMVPVADLKRWKAAFSEEAAAYYPDTIHHVSASIEEIEAVLAAAPSPTTEQPIKGGTAE